MLASEVGELDGQTETVMRTVARPCTVRVLPTFPDKGITDVRVVAVWLEFCGEGWQVGRQACLWVSHVSGRFRGLKLLGPCGFA